MVHLFKVQPSQNITWENLAIISLEQAFLHFRGMAKSRLRFAVVCSSNMNRSMEAHSFLNKKGYNIESYGTGNMIKIPGESERKPNTCR